MISRRERLRRCYFHEEMDRPAVYTRSGIPRKDPTYDKLRALLEKRSELKYEWHTETVEERYPIEDYEEPYSEDYQQWIQVLHTPKGDLRSVRLVSLKGKPGLTKEYFLKTAEDAEKYLSLPLPKLKDDIRGYLELGKKVGDRGIVHAVAEGGSPGGHTSGLFGSENFAILSVTDRDALHALCKRRQEMMMHRLKHLIQLGVGPFFSILGEELVSPPMHGPQDFRDFIAQYEKPIIDLVHEAGGRVHIHCHGSVKKVIGDFVEMGTDVLHPFEPPPMGDITAAEAKGFARGKMCLEGNIQIADMYEKTPEQIREQTEALIRDAFDDKKGLIVAPTASPYIRGAGEQCFPQYKAMIDTVVRQEKG